MASSKTELIRVRAVDRAPGLVDTGVFKVVTVHIPDTCPRCGGLRGRPTPFALRRGNHRHIVDRWINPCGHFDTSRATLVEAAAIAMGEHAMQAA